MNKQESDNIKEGDVVFRHSLLPPYERVYCKVEGKVYKDDKNRILVDIFNSRVRIIGYPIKELYVENNELAV